MAQNFARHSLDVLNELALRTCNRSNNCPLRKKSKLRAAKKQTPNQYSICVYIYIYTHDIHVSQFLKLLSYSASTNNKFNKKNLPSSLSFTTIYRHHICHHHTKISPPTNGHVSARPTAVCSTAAVKNHCKWLNFVTQTFGINQKTWWDDSTSQSGEFQLNLFCYIIHDDFKNLKKLLDIWTTKTDSLGATHQPCDFLFQALPVPCFSQKRVAIQRDSDAIHGAHGLHEKKTEQFGVNSRKLPTWTI